MPFLDRLLVGDVMPALCEMRGDCEVAVCAFATLEDAAPWVVFIEVGFDKCEFVRFG
jgi:hypothetical protein